MISLNVKTSPPHNNHGKQFKIYTYPRFLRTPGLSTCFPPKKKCVKFKRLQSSRVVDGTLSFIAQDIISFTNLCEARREHWIVAGFVLKEPGGSRWTPPKYGRCLRNVDGISNRIDLHLYTFIKGKLLLFDLFLWSSIVEDVKIEGCEEMRKKSTIIMSISSMSDDENDGRNTFSSYYVVKIPGADGRMLVALRHLLHIYIYMSKNIHIYSAYTCIFTPSMKSRGQFLKHTRSPLWESFWLKKWWTRLSSLDQYILVFDTYIFYTYTLLYMYSIQI